MWINLKKWLVLLSGQVNLDRVWSAEKKTCCDCSHQKDRSQKRDQNTELHGGQTNILWDEASFRCRRLLHGRNWKNADVWFEHISSMVLVIEHGWDSRAGSSISKTVMLWEKTSTSGSECSDFPSTERFPRRVTGQSSDDLWNTFTH